MKKVISKGYTLEVVSWENDGDNYKTKCQVFDTKEEALAVKNLCENIFLSSNNNIEGGIGNLMEDEGAEAKLIIMHYLANNTYLIKDIESFETNESYEDECIDLVMDYNYNLMGSSEYYYSRVLDSYSLYYSKEDVFLEEVV